jgi:phosphatidylserine/phosphatidylglycerophosphate/cardiolipin synthase-like enzyme
VTSLAAAVAQATATLAPAHLSSLADAYRKCGEYTESVAASVLRSVPAPHRDAVADLNAAWRESPDLAGGAMALALEAAIEARQQVRPTELEIVVTGPASPAAPGRLTSQVVQQLIDQALARVMLVSFSAYRVANVIDALDRAVARGVAVQLVLESAEQLPGWTDANAYAKYQVFEWPVSERQPASAKLHAKAVIVDGQSVLLTSANLTNAAFDQNLELGILCRGGKTAAKSNSTSTPSSPTASSRGWDHDRLPDRSCVPRQGEGGALLWRHRGAIRSGVHRILGRRPTWSSSSTSHQQRPAE